MSWEDGPDGVNVAEETEAADSLFCTEGTFEASALISASLCCLKSLSLKQKLTVLQQVIDKSVIRVEDLAHFS